MQSGVTPGTPIPASHAFSLNTSDDNDCGYAIGDVVVLLCRLDFYQPFHIGTHYYDLDASSSHIYFYISVISCTISFFLFPF